MAKAKTPVENESTAAAAAPVVQVTKIVFKDSGQDFQEWYVRQGIVIDCQPFQGTVWVGSKIPSMVGSESAVPVAPRAGELLQIVTRGGNDVELKHQIAKVIPLSDKESAALEEIGRNWAPMIGKKPEDLGL